MTSPGDPIEIVVENGHWNAYGEPTPRNLELAKILTEIGGPAKDTADGLYHFNVEIIEGTDAYASFTKVE